MSCTINKKKSKFVFILGSVSQPRCIKRINSFIENNIDVDVFGFDRGKQSLNASVNGKEIIVLSKQEAGKKYIRRLFEAQLAIRSVVSRYKNERVVYYSFGFLPTVLLFYTGVRSYIYEISDILYGYRKFRFFRWGLKSIDKLLIKRSILTVMTSKGFSNYFFKAHSPDNIIVQPNKLPYSFLEKIVKERPNSESLVFSFVGTFRSPETIFRFARIIGANYPEFEFYFYGDSQLTGEVIELSDKYINIKYFGPFQNPEQLEEIYHKIDIVVACYNNKELNERILEPNKLYEALFFKKPIIVSEGTYLAERIKYYGCGFDINPMDDNSIISLLDSIDIETLESIKDNIKNIPLEETIDDNSKKIISYLEENI